LDRADPTGRCAEDACVVEGGAAALGAAAYYGSAVLVAAGICVEACGAIHNWIGDKASAIWSHIVHNDSKLDDKPASSTDSSTRSKSNPLKGEPGSVSETKTRDGQPKQTREYGDDGYPNRDVDHDHGQGQPHVHDWTRPPEGSAPTHEDRQQGRAPKQNEVENLRDKCPNKTTGC
jgi:hypothetical protein